jgi:hypothetical protein
MYVRAYDPRRAKGDMVFDVDFETGVVSGRDADLVNFWLDDHGGRPLRMPWLQSYPCPDPRHDPRDMAMFARWLAPEIEGPLAEYPYPEIEQLPDGAVA